MKKILYSGQIVSDFQGFNENAIFKMSNGTIWVQEQYEYWYYYAYRPNAQIVEENGRIYLSVAGRSIPVIQVFGAIESRIDGKFEGWKGDTRYKLVNGQEWQQARYKYEYKYAYRPEVIICNVHGGYIMSVAGTQACVKRIRSM